MGYSVLWNFEKVENGSDHQSYLAEDAYLFYMYYATLMARNSSMKIRRWETLGQCYDLPLNTTETYITHPGTHDKFPLQFLKTTQSGV